MRDFIRIAPRSSCSTTNAPFALTRTGTAVLLTVFVSLGLIGHDPWKQDEAYAFDIVYNMLSSGDWVVPTLAGEAFVEKPPLVYILAALAAKLTASFLSLHDGARLVSGVAVTLYGFVQVFSHHGVVYFSGVAVSYMGVVA